MPAFKVLAVVSEYRTYHVEADNEEDARLAVVNAPEQLDHEHGDDTDDPPAVVDIWEV